MVEIVWKGDAIVKDIRAKSMDGIREWCEGVWLPAAVAGCPVDTGVMRESLGVDPRPSEVACYVGGGGASEPYIMKQELDVSLHHTVGHARFITRAVNENVKELPEIIKKHTEG
jgi:hypothetical protein